MTQPKARPPFFVLFGNSVDTIPKFRLQDPRREIDLKQLTYGRERALKERVAHWREVLDAAGV